MILAQTDFSLIIGQTGKICPFKLKSSNSFFSSFQ